MGPDAAGRRPDRTGSGDGPRRQLPLHAVRHPAQRDGHPRDGHRADPPRGSRAERLDVCRPGSRRHPHRHALGHRRRHLRPEGAAPRRRQRRSDEDADRGRPGCARGAHRRLREGQVRAQGEDLRLRAPRLQHRGSPRHAPPADVEAARATGRQSPLVRDVGAHRGAGQVREEALPERGLLLGVDVLHDGHRHRSLHADLRRQPHLGLDRARARAARQQSLDSAREPTTPGRRIRRPGCPSSSDNRRSCP